MLNAKGKILCFRNILHFDFCIQLTFCILNENYVRYSLLRRVVR